MCTREKIVPGTSDSAKATHNFPLIYVLHAPIPLVLLNGMFVGLLLLGESKLLRSCYSMVAYMTASKLMQISPNLI